MLLEAERLAVAAAYALASLKLRSWRTWLATTVELREERARSQSKQQMWGKIHGWLEERRALDLPSQRPSACGGEVREG